MFSGDKEMTVARGATVVAVGVTAGFAAYELVQAVVRDLLEPAISVLVGSHHFAEKSFSISGSEFRYGETILSALILVLVCAVGYLLIARPYRRDRG